MVHREIAKYPPEFGDLKVEILANKWYFQRGVKEDNITTKIIYSKTEDKTSLFLEDVKVCYREYYENFDLICVIPKSQIGEYSVTLNSIAEKLSQEFKVKFDNIIQRIKNPAKKMTECSSALERCKVHRGTFGLTRKLKDSEKIILLLDDIKAGGDTKLLCAKLLLDSGAKNVKAICLGINTTDKTKSN